MESLFVVGINKILYAGYFLLIAWLNCMMYLIAAFYRKKFNQPAPRLGFIVAIMFTFLYVASLFFIEPSSAAHRDVFSIVQTLCLIGSAVASGWSSVNLLIAMKKPRK